MSIAYAQQDKAERLLRDVFKGQPEKIQAALQYQGKFTDFSGRTFNCTAYEYAYWAKDTYMCRMLERHMDGATKAYMFARITEIERIDANTDQPVGLVYSQGDLEHRSAHFDLTPLISALHRYVDVYYKSRARERWDVIDAAWMEVGIAQHDIPVHVLNEYCHPDRSFNPRPEFNEEILPRNIRFYNWRTLSDSALFPVVFSGFYVLGIDFALCRGGGGVLASGMARGPEGLRRLLSSAACGDVCHDLAAVSHLDEVKNGELRQLHESLRPTDPEPSQSMHL